MWRYHQRHSPMKGCNLLLFLGCTDDARNTDSGGVGAIRSKVIEYDIGCQLAPLIDKSDVTRSGTRLIVTTSMPWLKRI